MVSPILPIKEFGINGITQEDLLRVVEHRLECFQEGDFREAEKPIEGMTSCPVGEHKIFIDFIKD